MQEIDGLKFVLDGELAAGLAHQLPIQIDYDDRFWFGIRVRVKRGRGGC